LKSLLIFLFRSWWYLQLECKAVIRLPYCRIYNAEQRNNLTLLAATCDIVICFYKVVQKKGEWFH